MFEPVGEPRPLPYPLKDQVSNNNVIPDEGMTLNEFVWPEDPEERTLFPLWISQREFTAIGSAMDVGADIAYPQQYVEVMWILMRNTRYQMSICSMIIDCITNDADVQAAIAALIATNPGVQDAIIDVLEQSDRFNDYISEKVQGLTTGQIVGKIVVGSCDNSVLAGRMVQIVERMNTINEDALEIIEVGTNDEEKIAALLEGIPVLDELPFGDIIDFMQDLLEDFAENYSAAVTEEWKDSVEEDLYCLAKQSEDCSLTFGRLFDYFQDRATSGLTIESALLDVVNFIVNGDFVGDDEIASAMYAAQIAFMRVGQEFFGMNLPKMGSLIRDAVPSTKWEEWDECGTPPPENCFDLTEAATPLNPTGSYAIWDDGVGVKSLYYGPPYNSDYWKATISPNVLGSGIVRVEIEFAAAPPSIRFYAGAVYLGVGTIDANKLYWEGTSGDWPISNVGTLWTFEGTGTDSAIAFPATAIQFCYEDDA